MLSLDQVFAGYRLGLVLHGISLEVGPGEVVCLLGRNGAGKSTTLKTVMGLLRPASGSVAFLGHELTRLRPHEICRLGLGFAPEDRRIFPDMTVLENLELARRPSADGAGDWSVDDVVELFDPLKPLLKRRGRYLSGGEQRMLTIARALMGNPKLLLLDEPSEGLAPRIVQIVWRQISVLRERGLAILLSEQNLHFASHLSDRLYIIDQGQIKFAGTFQELERQPEVKRGLLSV